MSLWCEAPAVDCEETADHVIPDEDPRRRGSSLDHPTRKVPAGERTRKSRMARAENAEPSLVDQKYVPAVARSDVNPVVWQATVAQAAVVEGLKSSGSSTAPGVRLARVATSTRYAIGSMPQTLAVSTRL